MQLLYNLLALAACASAAAVPPKTPTVDLGYAKYRGVRLPSGVDQFLGMRFAKPPVGDLRFRAPQDPDVVEGIQDASQFGSICVGGDENVDGLRAEDCLYVNVFRPSNATSCSKLPVWLYIQGGGYKVNADYNHNGSTVVQESGQNMIFVNFNYRVGALGFLNSEEVRNDGSLNAGLLDQRKVLHWVKKNIAKFGGDPNHVVIHGDSAGGGSVSFHLTAYGAEKDNDLFVGAAPQNPFWPTLRTASEMEFQYERLLNQTKCTDLACLRQLDINTFQQSTRTQALLGAASNDPLPLWYWLPVVDDDLVVGQFYDMFDQGRFIRVPLLVGDDTNEGSYFAVNANTEDEVSVFLKNNYPHLTNEQLQEIRDFYPQMAPEPKHNAWFPTASAAYGDCTFTCPGNYLATSMARYLDPSRVWNYRFNVQDPDNLANGLGVPHAFEMTAVLGVGNVGFSAPSYSGINANIVPVTMDYYISFIRTLNPNTYRHAGSPTWDAFGDGTGQRLKLQTNETAMEIVPESQVRQCALWRSLASELEQ